MFYMHGPENLLREDATWCGARVAGHLLLFLILSHKLACVFHAFSSWAEHLALCMSLTGLKFCPHVRSNKQRKRQGTGCQSCAFPSPLCISVCLSMHTLLVRPHTVHIHSVWQNKCSHQPHLYPCCLAHVDVFPTVSGLQSVSDIHRSLV
jgi:hypothetical protein